MTFLTSRSFCCFYTEVKISNRAINKEEKTMITCKDCGRLNEGKELGKSWICEDCKEGDPTLKDSPVEPIVD